MLYFNNSQRAVNVEAGVKEFISSNSSRKVDFGACK